MLLLNEPFSSAVGGYGGWGNLKMILIAVIGQPLAANAEGGAQQER